jgi:hypothetical protein
MRQIGLVIATTLAACSASLDDDPVTATIVVLHDGKASAVTRVVPRAEVEAALHQRAQDRGMSGPHIETLMMDPACGGASLWLFDGPAGGPWNHMLCLDGTGSVSLSIGPAGALPTLGSLGWPYTVNSFYPGVAPGLFSHASASCTTVACGPQSFTAWQVWTDLSPGFTTSDLLSLYQLPPFARSWDGVHQFVEGDGPIGMPVPMTSAPAMLASLVSTSSAALDFVWEGDNYPNCWHGDASCTGLPSPRWSPVVGHYAPLSGVSMLGHGRCVDASDCPSGWDCKPLPQLSGPRYTLWVATYTDASGTPENVCVLNNDYWGSLLTAAQEHQTEYSYWHRTHPSWLLYTSPQDDAAHLAWVSGGIPFDISNPAVINELVGRAARWPAITSDYGALSVDTVYLANYPGGHYTRQLDANANWTWSVPRTVSGLAMTGRSDFGSSDCGGGYCDPAWAQLVLDALGRWRDEAHRLGLDLVVNVGYSGTGTTGAPAHYIAPTDSLLQHLFDTVDGVFDEGGFTLGHAQGDYLTYDSAGNDCGGVTWRVNGTYACGTSHETQPRWSDYAAYMQSVQSRGKPYFTKNIGAGSSSDEYNHPSPEPAAISWALASYLMSRGTSPTLAAESLYMGDSIDVGYVPPASALGAALDPAVGHPCEAAHATTTPNVYTRTYSHGYVVVNANPPAEQGMTDIVFQPAYPPAGSWTTTPPANVGPQTGVVMVSTSSLCP